MNTASDFSEDLRRILAHPSCGVTGLVDDLLMVCRAHDLQLDWQADRLRVRTRRGHWEELLDIPLRKSVFRAVLARFAVLCNQRMPNTVSPYGGQGELVVGANPPTVFRVAFTNTSAEQKLELLTEIRSADGVSLPQDAPSRTP